MNTLTPELVRQAYAALASGDQTLIQQYWANDLRWLVPGHNPLSGWKTNLQEFLQFMSRVGELSAHSFRMDSVAIMTGENSSADVTRNLGNRANQPERKLDINVIHFLRWREGKVIEGQGSIFGDGTAQYDKFWA